MDDRALAILRGLPGRPYTTVEASSVYLVLMGMVCTLWLGVGVSVFKAERQNIKEVLSRSKLNALLLGFGMYGLYPDFNLNVTLPMSAWSAPSARPAS